MLSTGELYDIYLKHPQICHDTRRIMPGCIYWAIRGERFDGNTFAAEALEKGAAYSVIDNPDFDNRDGRCLLVDDTLEALQALARHHRKALGLPLIAIAGSNGKTTTKELTRLVLASRMETFATPGNFNNHIGLPLSLLQLTDQHKAAVIELGANHLRENADLCEICLPDAGLITSVGKDHLEGFGSVEGVITASLEVFDYLAKAGGTALINADETDIQDRIPAGLKSLTYGTGDNVRLQGHVTGRFPYLTATLRDLQTGEEAEVRTSLFGSFHLYNVLAAAAAGLYLGVPLKDAAAAMEQYKPSNNRSQFVKQGSNTLIMDAYNANPSSMQAAVSEFADFPAAHKVLLLGDMFEMGEESEAEHKAILDHIRWDNFTAVGLAGEAFYQFRDKYPAHFFRTTEELREWYRTQAFSDAYIYLKGSRGMKMETVVG